MNYGFVYETTNLITNMKYIGSHSRSMRDIKNDPDDSWYLGSGTYIVRAIDRYGIENFSRKILVECDSEEELVAAETHILEEIDAASNPMYYNLTNSGYTRGITGYAHTEKSKYMMRINNYVHINGRSETSKIKQSNTLKKTNHQEILAERVRDTKWYTDSKMNKRLSEEDATIFLRDNKDWYQGFTDNRSHVVFSEETKKKLSNSRKEYLNTDSGKEYLESLKKNEKFNAKGRIWISKDGVRKYVYPSEITYYLSEGWRRGMKN